MLDVKNATVDDLKRLNPELYQAVFNLGAVAERGNQFGDFELDQFAREIAENPEYHNETMF